MQADGKILAGGDFTSIGGQTRNHIARLDATTGLADSFDPNANDVSVNRGAGGRQDSGGRRFTSIGGQTRNRIARLDATTGLADSFDPNANGFVHSIAVQADGKILAGGYFTSIGGQTRSLFARLTNDTAALQNLAVTQTTITWTRGGSSPQFTRVTFESSTDNVNYTPLGNGTAAGSNWTLTGLNLPTGQNIYIRARGYYRSGYSKRLGEHHGIGAECVSILAAHLRRSSPERSMAAPDLSTSTCRSQAPPASNAAAAAPSSDYQLIFSFANTLTSVGNASVTSGTGSVSSHMITRPEFSEGMGNKLSLAHPRAQQQPNRKSKSPYENNQLTSSNVPDRGARWPRGGSGKEIL